MTAIISIFFESEKSAEITHKLFIKRILYFDLILCWILFLIVTGKVKAQSENNREIFESRRLQIEFLLQQTDTGDSLVLNLVKEADYFAGQNSYDLAIDLLDQSLELISGEPENQSADEKQMLLSRDISMDFNTSWSMSLEAGTDYSRSEYELSFIESDSVILEELHQPYGALRISRNFSSQKRAISLLNYTRLDESLFQTSLGFTMDSGDDRKDWRLDAHSDFFWLLQESSGTFWDNELNLFYAVRIRGENHLYFAGRSRYKQYFPDSRSYQNLLDIRTDLSFRHYFEFLHWCEILLDPSIYQENSTEGLHYRQLHLQTNYHLLQQYNRYIDIKLNYTLRNFKVEESVDNLYRSFQPVLDAELPLLSPFGLQGYAEWEVRNYRKTDLTYSNFTCGSFNTRLKFYLTPVSSFGAGVVYEYQKNKADLSDRQLLVTQEDYNARGWIISADILNLNGLMLSLTYQQTLRDYPNGGANDFLGIYTNRRVNSLMGFAQIPLSPRWSLEFFANYDSDRDRDRPNNDHLNTIFNLSVRYVLF
jgi:hypothetical protein